MWACKDSAYPSAAESVIPVYAILLLVEGCLVVNRPLQHFMNAAFAAEAATTKYCELLQTTSGLRI
jgi:hypothetical protein